MQKCAGFFGWLFGHKYQARYDEQTKKGLPPETGNRQISGEDIPGILEAMCSRESSCTYVHDVCVRCGNVIGRTPPGEK